MKSFYYICDQGAIPHLSNTRYLYVTMDFEFMDDEYPSVCYINIEDGDDHSGLLILIDNLTDEDILLLTLAGCKPDYYNNCNFSSCLECAINNDNEWVSV